MLKTEIKGDTPVWQRKEGKSGKGRREGAEAWCQRPHTEAPWTEPSGGHARPARESWAAAGGAEGCSGAGAAAAALLPGPNHQPSRSHSLSN